MRRVVDTGQAIYMKVTKDEYELPLALADSIEELAELLGAKQESIKDGVYRRNKFGSNTAYVKVLLEEEV